MADCINSGIRKTRKEHLCVGCRELFPKGTEMYWWAVADGGTVDTVYSCKPCIDWCKEHNCHDCHDSETADEGFVSECRKQQEGKVE